ncbi:MAG: hypothetical protein GYB35_16055 [Algicola sp.]|nr:hypothetical protein [Algicola sp.]
MVQEKHLEFIQDIINRYNSNSFIIKGWAITIVSALYALSGTVKEPKLVLTAIVPIILFWFVDSYYLSNERCFVDLYNSSLIGEVKLPKKKTLKSKFQIKEDNFLIHKVESYDMNFKIFKIWIDNSLFRVMGSKTIFWFYFGLLLVTILIWIFFTFFGQSAGINNCPQQCV